MNWIGIGAVYPSIEAKVKGAPRFPSSGEITGVQAQSLREKGSQFFLWYLTRNRVWGD
jgi:hypothetical protein